MPKRKYLIMGAIVATLMVLAVLLVVFRITSYGALTCVEEGYTCANGSTGPWHKYLDDECCEGLKPVYAGLKYKPQSKFANSKGCVAGEGYGSVCVNCGDSICGKYENKCNCPEDCGQANQGNQTNQPESIEYQDFSDELNCISPADRDEFIIKNNEEYKELIAHKIENSKCSKFNLPSIDFSKNILLGKRMRGGGCSVDFKKEVHKRSSDKVIVFTVKALEEGNCKMLVTDFAWILVPKLEAGFDINFEEITENKNI